MRIFIAVRLKILVVGVWQYAPTRTDFHCSLFIVNCQLIPAVVFIVTQPKHNDFCNNFDQIYGCNGFFVAVVFAFLRV
jgi:hypothetical protein